MLPIVQSPEDRARDILVRVVRDLTYAFILGPRFFRANNSVTSLGVGKGFHPSPESPWDIYYTIQPAADNPPPLVPPPPSVPHGQCVPWAMQRGTMTVRCNGSLDCRSP